jgi:hypothetical protein
MFRPTWVIFRINTCNILKRQYTFLSVDTELSVYKFITLRVKILFERLIKNKW